MLLVNDRSAIRIQIINQKRRTRHDGDRYVRTVTQVNADNLRCPTVFASIKRSNASSGRKSHGSLMRKGERSTCFYGLLRYGQKKCLVRKGQAIVLRHWLLWALKRIQSSPSWKTFQWLINEWRSWQPWWICSVSRFLGSQIKCNEWATHVLG